MEGDAGFAVDGFTLLRCPWPGITPALLLLLLECCWLAFISIPLEKIQLKSPSLEATEILFQ